MINIVILSINMFFNFDLGNQPPPPRNQQQRNRGGFLNELNDILGNGFMNPLFRPNQPE